MRLISVRHGDCFTAHFVQTDVDFAIIVGKQGPEASWRGAATFPRNYYEIAAARFSGLVNDVDVEDLLREWGDTDGETLANFIAFSSEVAQHDEESEGAHVCPAYNLNLAGLDEDLPEIIVDPSTITRVVKQRRERKPKDPKPQPLYVPRSYPVPDDAKTSKVALLPLDQYDHVIVSFSGGKDSIACVLYLLELGVKPERIELWHQCVDGRPGRDERVWDWPCTESYCQAFADAFGMKLLFQWKEGGYLGEMFKHNRQSFPTTIQMSNGRELTLPADRSEVGTRLVWPAITADLRTRWCSGYLKVDVARKVFTNDPRFTGKRSIFLTGERREESQNRARYEEIVDESVKKRTVHHWRAVISWFEKDVWQIIERYHVRPHPAYLLGWSRVSCLPCIFGNEDQWAAVKDVAPHVFDRLAALEDKFYVASRTLPEHPWSMENQARRWPESEERRRKKAAEEGLPFEPQPFKYKNYDGYLRAGESLPDTAARGKSYAIPAVAEWLPVAMNEHYPAGMIKLGPNEKWKDPYGAYKHSGGPT
jgi:3'-phosphoadenosine 5'-phosphosulfate sulfotransferase (PAPS reductase)/FAD synthetase